MSDNVTTYPAAGGPVIRTVGKTATGAQAQVILLDIGGGTDASPESLVSGANPLPVADSQSAPFAGAVAMTSGSSYAAQRSVGVNCTVAGNVQFQFPDGSTLTLPVYPGWQTFPFACTQIVSAATTATATYFNLK